MNFFNKENTLVSNMPIGINKFLSILFVLIFPLVSQLMSAILLMPISVVYTIININNYSTPEELIDSLASKPIVHLFSTLGCIIFYFLAIKLIHNGKLSSLGIVFKKKNLKEYAIGFLGGIGLFSIAAIIIYATGNATFSFTGLSISTIPTFLLLIAMWGVQGASEEVMMRGYALPLLGKTINVPIAIIISSGYFSVMHLGNPSINNISLINIFLVGIVFALYSLYSGNIMGACAMHSAWNFAQGNIFGFSVSGLGNFGVNIISSTCSDNTLVNGGGFGPEGGLGVTIACIIGIIIFSILMKRKKEMIEN